MRLLMPSQDQELQEVASPKPEPEFWINVKTLTGKSLPFRVRGSDTVLLLKKLLETSEGIPMAQQRIVLDGRELDDEKTLDDLGISEGGTVYLMLRLRGGIQPCIVRINGQSSTLHNAEGEEIANFTMRTSSVLERMVASLTFTAAEHLEQSRFQHFYQGDGKVRDIEAALVLQGLFEAGVHMRVAEAGDQHGHKFTFIDTDRDRITFQLVGDEVTLSCPSPSLHLAQPRAVRSVLVHAGEIHCELDNGATWKMTPAEDPDFSVVIRLYRMVARTSVKHHFDMEFLNERWRKHASEQSSQVFERLVDQFGLAVSAAGALKLYTAEITIFGQKFYRILSNSLGADSDLFLQHLWPYIVQLNKFLNETRHLAAKLFCGGTLPDECCGLLQVGKRVRVPRVLSTSAREDVARRFKGGERGVFFVIHVPEGFWGARSVADISEFFEEQETVFCPYSQYVVLAFDPSTKTVELAAIDKYYGTSFALPVIYARDAYTTLTANQKDLLPA